MPKKAKGGKKGAKPEWMSDDVYQLSQNPAQLMDAFRPPAERTGAERLVSREQVCCRN